ncbi:MAG: UDP-N-acetylmuramoyl-tripeptide--D-alanyl-D-alanine ligase [Verrucomicrobiota bacterium]
MPCFAPDRLATWSSGRWTAPPAVPVTGFSFDSRSLAPGQAFVALRTGRRDGHDFLADARARGASCALVSRTVDDVLPQLVVDDAQAGLRRIAAAWREAFAGPVIGVTGSVGKTSTKDLLGALLGPAAFVTEANLNNTLGVPLMLLRTDSAVHRWAVIEAGMSLPGELGLSARVLSPDVAIVTAVAAVHLEGVGGLDGVAREKSELVAALRPGGRAVIPASLLEWPSFAAHAGRCVAVRFVGEPDPAVKPARLVEAALGCDASGRRTLTVDGRPMALGPVSDGLARNAALAVVAAGLAGADAGAVVATLASWTPPAGRGSLHVEGARSWYVDCYNSSPASLLDSAACFDRLSRDDAEGRLWIVGGMAELGPDSLRMHREAFAALPVRAGDLVAAFGGDAPAALDAVPSPAARLAAASHVELAAAAASRRGFVFVKGSRSHALERALPESVRTQVHFH